jgi:hypothetical protein
MSQSLSTLVTCANIQDQLNTHFLTQMNPLDVREKQLFTDVFVNSALNTNGILQSKVSPGRGKKKAVELIYTPPLLESEIGSSPEKKCTSTNEKGALSHTYEIETDEGSNYDEKFDLINMASMCMDNPLWIAARIQAAMDGITKKIGTDNATQLALLTGAFGDGETGVTANVKTINTLKSGTTDFDLSAWAKIVFAAENAGYPGAPIVFGWDTIYQYMKEAKAGCCANNGIDISQYVAQNDLVFMADKKIKTALGSQNFLMLAPGAVQMLSWLEFEGENGINVIDDESYKQTVITDPKTGFRFDLQLKNDCGNIIINIKLAHKLVGLPSDMFQVGDAFQNVTFVNEFAIVNS